MEILYLDIILPIRLMASGLGAIFYVFWIVSSTPNFTLSIKSGGMLLVKWATATFVGYMAGELSEGFGHHEKLSYAAAGLVGYLGPEKAENLIKKVGVRNVSK